MTDLARSTLVSTAAASTAAQLVDRGVRHVFVHSAPSIRPLLQAIRETTSIEIIHMRSSTSVAFAAAGYARATGELGVAICGGGPAATSLMTGIYDAQMDSIPLLVLAGQVRADKIGTDAWRDSDTIGMTSTITKHNWQAGCGDELNACVQAGITLATTGRKGVVFIAIPEDIFERPCDPWFNPATLLRGYRVPNGTTDEQVERFYDLLDDAQRPLILIGGGGIQNDAESEILALAEELNLPIATTMTAKGAIPETHPHAVGMLGAIGRRSAIWAWQRADLIISFGARFADPLTGDSEAFFANRRFVQIDIDPVELGKHKRAHLEIATSALDAAQRLRAGTNEQKRATKAAKFQPWLNQCATAAGFHHRGMPYRDDEPLHPRRIMDMINQRRRSDEIVVCGVGEHQLFAAHYLNFQRPRTLVTSCGASARGFSVPGAVGAAVGAPRRRLVLIEGDGGFQAGVHELANVASLKLPILILVLDQKEQARNMSDDTVPTPDFVAIARAFDIDGFRAKDQRELEDLLDEHWNSRAPLLIQVDVAPVKMEPRAPRNQPLSAFQGGPVPAPGQLFTRDEARLLEQVATGSFDDEP